MTYTMCDCPEYEGPHDPSMRCVLRVQERVHLLEDMLEMSEEWSDDDEPLPEDDAIKAAFPTRSGSHETYAEAMRMVGAKRSKGALVALVNWLLVELGQLAERAERADELERRYADVVPADDAARAEMVRLFAERQRLVMRKHFGNGDKLAPEDEQRLAGIEARIDEFEMEEAAPGLRRMEQIADSLKAVSDITGADFALELTASRERERRLTALLNHAREYVAAHTHPSPALLGEIDGALAAADGETGGDGG